MIYRIKQTSSLPISLRLKLIFQADVPLSFCTESKTDPELYFRSSKLLLYFSLSTTEEL